MYRRGIFLVLCLFISSNFASTQQYTREQIEDIIFDFRVGVDWKIKDKGAEQLVQMGETVVPILIECLREQLPESLSKRIDEANQKSGVQLASPANGSSIPVQGWAETILKRIGKPAVPKLIASIKTQPETISSVARILGEIGDKRAVPPIISVLNDPHNNWPIKADNANALATLGSPEAIPYLIEELNGQPNDPYNNDKYVNIIADALVKLSGQSFGFTMYFKPPSKNELSQHFRLDGSPSEKEKVIQKWKEWWQEYNTILINVPKFLETHASLITNSDTPAIHASRSKEYVQQIGGHIIDDSIPENKENSLLNYTKELAASYQQLKITNYRIKCKDIKTEQNNIIVLAEDKVIFGLGENQIIFSSKVKRILVKDNNSYKIKGEYLLMWTDITYESERQQ